MINLNKNQIYMKPLIQSQQKRQHPLVADGIPVKQAAEMQASVRMYKSLAIIALIANGLAALLGALYL